VIIGKVYFLLVRIKIKHMEIALIKRESTGSGPNLNNETETLTKFEIMDGAPVRGIYLPTPRASSYLLLVYLVSELLCLFPFHFQASLFQLDCFWEDSKSHPPIAMFTTNFQ
jgi:Vacuolar protein sorting-associated protein 26